VRTHHLAGLATATAVVLGVVLPFPAAAAEADTIYVNNGTGSNCSNDGSGTAAQPFCTIQAAADAAQPGQTVRVAGGKYVEQVKLNHSGTADKPITFVGGSIRDRSSLPMIPLPTSGSHAFSADGAHDIKVTGFRFASAAEAVLLTGTQRITFEGNYIWGGSSAPAPPAAIRVTGGSEDTTLNRNILYTEGQQSISIEAGAKGTVVTGNAVTQKRNAGGITVTDAPGTVINGNSISAGCSPSLALLGDSSGAVVENNLLAADPYNARNSGLCTTPTSRLKVSDASRAGTTVDYNIADPYGYGAKAYDWAGTLSNSLKDAGQGAHDLIADPKLGTPELGLQPASGSPAIDSADASAPGAAETDLFGYHRIDDPYVTNSGTGSGIHDRGAAEYTTSSRSVLLQPSADRVPTGAPVTIEIRDQESWSPVVSYAVDFGDGSEPAVTTGASVQHSYATPGVYRLKVTVTSQNGDSNTMADSTVTVSEPGPLVPGLTVFPVEGPLTYTASAGSSYSPWTITKEMIDYGDGTTADLLTTYGRYSYRKEGDYTVTLTVTDAGGRTEKVSQKVHVAYQPAVFQPMEPVRVMDTRGGYAGRTTLGAGQTLTIPLGTRMAEGLPTIPLDYTPTAVVLNVTALSKDSESFLTVYPAGTDRPATSSLNVAAKQVVPNLVTVPVGPDGNVAVYNKSGNVDVVADIFGYYYTSGSNTGDKFTAQAPVRLADTRSSGTRLGQGGETTIQVAGKNGVPLGATAAVLNVTSTGSTAPSFLTVYPAGGKRPETSNLNFTAGQTVPNQVVVPLSADGKVTVYNHAGSTDVVADLFGWYSPGGEALFTPVTPTRLVDTRTEGGKPIGPGATLSVASGAPAGATGAVLNVTGTGSTAGGYLTVWADGTQRPGTSNLNFTTGQTVPNHVTTPLGANGKFDLYNFKGTTDAVADVFGYFTKG